MDHEMEIEKPSVIGIIDKNKRQIYKALNKMEQLLELQEDMNAKQEQYIYKKMKNQDSHVNPSDIQVEELTLETQKSSIECLENIYYLITEVDKNFEQIIENLPSAQTKTQFKKNKELDLIVNKLLLDTVLEQLNSGQQVLEDSKYIYKFDQ